MRQSNIIFGTLLLAFVIYITLRGQLPEYIALFTGASTQSATPTTNGDNRSQVDNKANKPFDFGSTVKQVGDLYSNMGLWH